MAVFAGIDLAWKTGKESGICIFEVADSVFRLLELDARAILPGELAEQLAGYGPGVIAAIDAPLILHPERVSDRLAASEYGKYGAAPFFPHEKFLALSGFAGRDLAVELLQRGFSLDPADMLNGRPARVAFEVFPHACHIEMLGAKLAYKKGVLSARLEGTLAYAIRLGAFLEPRLPTLADLVRPLAAELAGGLRGRALKHVEDQLDAVTCGYAAWHVWTHGATGTRVFGDWRTGAIVVPILADGRPIPLALVSGAD